MLDIRPDIAAAFRDRLPVVALESTLIAHGLPWPLNLETAREAEAVVRAGGGVPATIAVLGGRPTIGLNDVELEILARGTEVHKASRRDLACAMVHGRTAATTVAATMFLAYQAGIRVFATGGIGGAHRGVGVTGDISADLKELARTPVAVVCAGAKGILDIRRTLEILETEGVPVIGYRTDDFPAFYVRTSGWRVSGRVDIPSQAAALLGAHWDLNGAGVVLAQPVSDEAALEPGEFEAALVQAEKEATTRNLHGPALTPFLLAQLADITEGKTLRANRNLIAANARLAAQVAAELRQR